MTLSTCKPFIAAFLLLGTAIHARAQDVKPPEFIAVHIGFADRYKAGRWTQVEVAIRGGTHAVTGRVRTTVNDSDGLACSVDAPEPCQLLPGKETTVQVYARFGREESSLHLELLDGRKVVASKTFDYQPSPKEDEIPGALLAGQGLIVCVGKDSGGMEQAVGLSQQNGRPRNVVAVIGSLTRLPTRWQGYEGVNAVVISTSSPEVLAKLSPQNARVEALDQWVRMGGKLVVCVGSQAEEALHSGSPLARFIPGRYEKTIVLHKADAWEIFAKSTNPITVGAGAKLELPTPRLSGVQGKVEVKEADDLPLVIRTPRGFGQVIFVAADLDRGVMRKWNDRQLLAAALLDLPSSDVPNADNQFGPVYGYTDLAGQLRSSLDQFTGVRLVPFSVVALLVVLYILLIGPGDYFLLRWLGRRMYWTWVTFPLIVAVFSIGAYEAAYRLKGKELRVNQVDLVDIDSSGAARGTSWFNIFSPQVESFDLTMKPQMPDGKPPAAVRQSLAWLGKAGNEFRDVQRRSGEVDVPLWGERYSISPQLDAIWGVPVQVWSTKSFTHRWTSDAPFDATAPAVETKLIDDGSLSGTITNMLPYPLTQAYLIYDRTVYLLDTLNANVPAMIDRGTRHISLDTFAASLRPDSAIESNFQAKQDPYDRSNLNALYILRTMMFYDSAGGSKHSGLSNDYQGFVDMSGLLKARRAIVVALPPQDGTHRGAELQRGPSEAAATPLGNPQDRHLTVFRLVCPVADKKD